MPEDPSSQENSFVKSLVDGYRYLLESGYDYIEFHVGGIANMSEEVFQEAVACHEQGKLTIESCNCFLPANLCLIGEAVDQEALTAYLRNALPRLEKLGVKTVVFGSGRARTIPEGTPAEQADAQLAWFLRQAEGVARLHGITIVIEPLNHCETNNILTVTEAAEIVRKLDLPNLKLLGDVYHMHTEQEPAAVLSRNGDILRHIHVCDPVKRTAPEDCDYLRQISQELHKAGYEGRVTIEAVMPEFATQVRQVQPLMRELF